MISAILRYVAAVVAIPTVVVVLSILIASATGNVALPFFAMILAPLVAIGGIAVFGFLTYRRAARLESRQRNAVLVVVLSSVFWAPALGWWFFSVLLNLTNGSTHLW